MFTDGMKDQLPVDLHQFKVILQSLSARLSDEFITRLFRECFEVKDAGVVCYNSFIIAAEKCNLFSEILRLPSYCGSVYDSSLSEKDASSLASVVEKHFVLFSDYLADNKMRLTPVRKMNPYF
jgi:hypothetical protein